MTLPPLPLSLSATPAVYQSQASSFPSQHLRHYSVNNAAISSPSTKSDVHIPMDPWDHRYYQEQQHPIPSQSRLGRSVFINSNGSPLLSWSPSSMHVPTHHFPAQHETPHPPRPSGYIHQPRLSPVERRARHKQSYQQTKRRNKTDNSDHRLAEYASARGRQSTPHSITRREVP